MDIEAIKGEIAAFHRGKKWIFTPDVAAAAKPMVEQLNGWGVDDLMIVAGVEGVGDLPNVDRIHYTRTSGETMMLGIRAFMESIEFPSPELLRAVDAFDPAGEAHVLGQMFSRRSHLAGRPVYGARPVEWRDLEDKTVVDELWDAAGIARVPAEVVAVADAPSAAERLGGELGSVWVADNREGWHGGGEYTRWVREPADVEPAAEWFLQHAHAVRVMPFLDGLPCSIHGFVTGNGVSVFNPVELLIYRRMDRPGFFYAGGANSGSHWAWCAPRCAMPLEAWERSLMNGWATAGDSGLTGSPPQRDSGQRNSTHGSASDTLPTRGQPTSHSEALNEW